MDLNKTQLRPSTGWIETQFTRHQSIGGSVIPIRSVSDDIWAELLLVTRDRDVFDIIAKRHRTLSLHSAKSWIRYGAYIRQAHEYFRNAEQISTLSASLYYYYSFMNLAKAYILLTRPKEIDSVRSHGLEVVDHTSIKNYNDQRVKVVPGIFSAFAEIMLGSKLKNHSVLGIQELMSYAQDVSYQAGEYQIHMSSTYGSKLRIMTSNYSGTSQYWTLMLVPKTCNIDKLLKLYPKLLKTFEKVIIDPDDPAAVAQYKQIGLNYFGIHVQVLNGYDLWQEINITTSNRFLFSDVRKFTKMFPSMFTEDLLTLDYDTIINTPILPRGTDTKLQPMNEIVADYASLFFWGSLVRYDPDILVNLNGTKEMWLGEEFVQSSPARLLRHFRNEMKAESLRYRN